MDRSIVVITILIIASLMLCGCVNSKQVVSKDNIKTEDKELTITTTSTSIPTQKAATPAPSSNYMRGDVISAYEDPSIMSYGWVISKYDSKNDLYYGYRAEFVNGKWIQAETDEYDLWSEKQTKKDFPYVLGHINLLS